MTQDSTVRRLSVTLIQKVTNPFTFNSVVDNLSRVRPNCLCVLSANVTYYFVTTALDSISV